MHNIFPKTPQEPSYHNSGEHMNQVSVTVNEHINYIGVLASLHILQSYTTVA